MSLIRRTSCYEPHAIRSTKSRVRIHIFQNDFWGKIFLLSREVCWIKTSVDTCKMRFILKFLWRFRAERGTCGEGYVRRGSCREVSINDQRISAGHWTCPKPQGKLFLLPCLSGITQFSLNGSIFTNCYWSHSWGKKLKSQTEGRG